MLPPRLIRRLVLAPLAVAIAAAIVVLFPPLALLAVLLGILGRSRPHRMRALRLLSFALIWLAAETATLFMSLGLWITSGFGGRLRTEPYQARHYALMEWYVAGSTARPGAPWDSRSRWRSRSSPRPSGRPGWLTRSSCSAATRGQGTRCSWCTTC